MKIYIIGECLDKVGGVERVMNALATNLYNRNENIELISETKNNETSFYEYDKNINIKYLVKYYPLLSNKFSNKFLFLFFRVFEYLKKKIKLNKEIKKSIDTINKDDILIFDRVNVALRWLPKLKNKNMNNKIIVRDAIHLYSYSNKIKKQMKYYFPLMVDTFIVSSEESIKEYNNFFEDNNINIIKIYNPLGVIPKVKYDYDSKVVVTIGRMDDDQKGFYNIIKTMNLVHEKYPDWQLNIYGDGINKNNYLKLIDSINANNYIKILPMTKDIVKVFNTSSIYVMASRFEGYANTLVEALSCGIPSISYNFYCGVEEIIQDGINGKVVKLQNRYDYFKGIDSKEDIKNLSKAIIELIKNKKECDKYKKKGPKIIESRNPNLIIDKWINEIYKLAK